MKKQLTQKEIFCSDEFYDIIKEYSFTKNINADEIKQAEYAYIRNAYIENKNGNNPKDSDFLRNIHIVMNTTFMYEYDDKFFGLYEFDGNIAIIKFYYGWELDFVGSSITNFYQESMVYFEKELADQLSEIISKKYNIPFKRYQDPESQEYDDIAHQKLYKSTEHSVQLTYPDFNKDYPELTGFFESDIEESLYYSMIENTRKFSKNSIRLHGVCVKLTETMFHGECVSAVDCNKDNCYGLFYPVKYFSDEDIQEIKKHLLSKREHFCFEMIIDYDIDNNNKITIINTKIKKIK